MTVRENAVHKNHNPTMYITELSPINHFFHNGCLSWPYLGNYLKEIEIKLGTYLAVIESKCRRQEP